MKCQFGRRTCMCQFCEKQCNNGLNCFECSVEQRPVHDIFLCSGFVGDIDDYINCSLKRGYYSDRVDRRQ